MKQNRVDQVMAALQEMGISQMLIVDPMSIYYLTGVYYEPGERFYALLLRRDGKHAYFLNHLFSIPQEVGVEKVWYSDTDPAMENVARYVDHTASLEVDKELKARFLLPLMELDLTARNLITEKGYGPQFNHRLGHFIGLAEHEFGDVSSVNPTPAAPGMIFLSNRVSI